MPHPAALCLCALLSAGGLITGGVAGSARAQGEATDLPAASPANLGAALSKALAERIVTVVEKDGPSPSGDPHEYVSYGRYWWPDPARPGGQPFIQRDGHVNEAQIRQGDERRLGRLAGAVDLLSLGWSVEHRADCARRAGDWLRAWFVDPATRMKPDLDYSQVHLGHAHNRGNAAGVLDGRSLSGLTADLGRLAGSPALSPADSVAVGAWFRAYLQWLLTSANGRAEHAAANNHGSWFLVQAVAIARYVGDEDTARRLCEEDRARIASQVRPDGSQPLELARVDGLSYSVFNLQAQFSLARLARPLGIDLVGYRAPNGASLTQAVAFLRPYNADPRKWPGRQLKPLAPGFLDEVLALAGPS